MAEWAYACRSCEDDPPPTWYASAARLDEMPIDTRIVRVRVGSQWRCAIVDRARRVAVEQALLHLAVASSEADCPACRERLAQQARSMPGAGAERPSEAAAPSAQAASTRPHPPSRSVKAAAISLQGTRFAVVLVALDFLRGGDADLAVANLSPSFGGVPVVLMAQEEDGAPCYHGDAELIRLLAGIPPERLPWKDYPVA